MLQTDYEFELPQGYVDKEGNLHKKGVMRLASAADEILPLKDPRVQQNPPYLTVVLLSRVITKLGSVDNIDTNVIEKLFSADFNYLQGLYQEINSPVNEPVQVRCPHCNEMHSLPFEVAPFLARGQ
ncbi:MAG: phage tail assembly protein [Defluviitaleaceae bacterium]|nr:phage tail assembly protein [Defluviitaleaceae bacterium]